MKSLLYSISCLLTFINITGCATMSLKASECTGTYSYAQYFKNIDGSSTLLQQYTITIVHKENGLIAHYSANGLETKSGIICTAHIKKRKIKLVFSKFEDENIKPSGIFTPGTLFMELEKKGNSFHGKYISDQQKQGIYIFNKKK